MRILIAEDNRVSRLALVSHLKRWGYEVEITEDGDAAWKILQRPDAPRLALLDLNMPGLSGLEVCQKTRALEGRDYVYIAILTASEGQEDIVRGFDAGVDDYITKPFNPSELQRRIRAAERILALQGELDAIYNTSPVAMMLVDQSFHIRNMNHAGSALLDRISEALHERCPLRALIMDALTTQLGRTGEEIALGDGESQGWFLCSSQPINVAGEKRVLLCLEDITSRKTAEMKLAELNKTLEARVEQRTEEVNALLQQKNEFVARLSHDLKTPLVPLVGLLPLVLKQSENPKSAKMLELAIKNVGYIKELAEKTLRLARLNTLDRATFAEEVDLQTEIKDAIAGYASALAESQCTIHNNITQPFRVSIDPLGLTEVLLNILSNAVKYGAADGSITIEAQRKEDTILISFTDTGIGMTPEQTKLVFDEFYKADKSRHDHTSSGLGLTICKNIMERYDGRIWLESPGLGRGTTVHLQLPVS